ncbi:MAG: S8 family serine peptidase [Gaiellaceae bacterium]
MLARRIVLVAIPILLLATAVASAGGSSGSTQAQPGGKATAAPSHSTKKINLATYPAKRWIVQLNGAPLATYRGGVSGYRATATASTGASRLDATSTRSRAYVSHLRSVQNAFAQRLARTLPGVRVQRSYQVVLNGLAVKMNRGQAAIARRMSGVRAVTPDVPYHLDMFSTPQQIGAPTLWGQLGGQGNAGAGVKVAIVDSGIFVRHDAAGAYTGNACFDDTGYTAPAGFPKGDTRFTNNKVIVARAYFRPTDPPIAGEDTPIQGTNSASPHGTHVAGTVACDAGTNAIFQGQPVPISGVAPRAYLLNYRVFYPSQSPEDFQKANAYTVELVKAIEDAVTDGADVISDSWGASYQNTLAWPDPMIQAADDAVDAGVVMVFANGNAGPDTATANSPAISPKVIGVGAVTKDSALFPGSISVTAPEPVPANLKNFQIGGAAFGPAATSVVGPAPLIPGERVSTAATDKSLGCSLTGDVSPYPAGSLTGSIALIERGVCNFSEKVYNAQRGGAIAAIIYNAAANGDAVATMGAGVHAADVTIPSWEIGRTNGVNTLAWANANPATAQAKFDPAPSVQPNAGDVVAGFSSRGPTTDKLLKPDVAAPGVNVLSSGYGSGAFPGPFVGFGQVSGTSMATPHVAGSAALLVQLHPDWTPAQIKSALMTTATENVWTNTAKTVLAGVLDRGAGRIDLMKAGNPGITLDHPSLSAGEITAGRHVDFTLDASDVSGAGGTWTISAVKTGTAATTANFDITPSAASVTLAANGTATFGVTVSATAAAAPGNYEGKVVLTNGATTAHVPVWLRVLPTTSTADVLLVDDDASSVSATFPDYSTVYRNTLTGLGVTFTYLDFGTQAFPSLNALHGYKAVLVFTGNNNSFNTSGFTTAALDRLSEWLDSGGKLFTTGQNMAETTDNNTSFSSPSIGRSRLYHGYLGVRYDAGSAYPGAAPRPTAGGVGPFAGMTIDVSPGADGAGNQSSIEVTSPMPDNDTYEAAHTMTPLLRAIGSTAQGPSAAVSFGRSSEPSLEEERVEYRYRSLSMGFGLEGVNDSTTFTSRAQLTRASLNWLLDRITFDAASVTPDKAKKKPKPTKDVDLTAHAVSNVGATITQYRWDFGDGEPWETTTTSSVDHKFKKWGTYDLRIEVTDSLGHRSVQHQTVVLSNH